MARPEVTGRKLRGGRKLGAKNKSRKRIPHAERSAHTIDEFCIAHRISRSQYYELKKLGLTPDEMAVGRSRFISDESAERWRREREAAAKEAVNAA
jgi:hypothetical protein